MSTKVIKNVFILSYKFSIMSVIYYNFMVIKLLFIDFSQMGYAGGIWGISS